MNDALGINPSPTGAMPMPSAGGNSPADQAKIKAAAQQQLTQRQGERQQLATAEQAIQPAPKPPTEAELTIHPKQATLFFPMMMALSALGGMNTRAPMTAAMNNMAAVMKGQMDGSAALTKQHEERMWNNYDAAMKAHESSMKDFKVALDKYNSTGDPTEMRLAILAKTGDVKLANQVSSNPHDANQYVETLAKLADGAQKHADEMGFKNYKLQQELADKSRARGQRTSDEYDKEISKLTDDMHNTVNPAQKTAIEDRIRELRMKRNAAQSGDSAAPAAASGKPAPTPADIAYVKAHPETRAAYVSHFGVEP